MTPPTGRPRVLLTLGDPRGIGPEVSAAAVRRFRDGAGGAELLLLGPDGLDPGVAPYHPVGPWDGTERGAGVVVAAAVREAVRLCATGEADAVVTGPIHKPALHAAGFSYPGHTEMLRDLTGADRVGMLMAAERTSLGGPLRVLLATTHIPLRDVPATLTRELLVDQTTLLATGLRERWGIGSPTIGLCGLNPHASDDGLFGDEEERIFRPALERLEGSGVDARGPYPADTVFRRALSGELDAVVAPYHDVGMSAFKTATFGSGVNVTLGLPFVRTSPDHGTAFDIAGTGRANASSMLEAVELAVRLAF